MKNEKMRHLHISPEFMFFLYQKRMFEPLMWTYKEFLEQRNLPLARKDRNIAWLSVFSSLCDHYGKNGKKVSIEKLVKKADEIIAKRYPEELKVAKEFAESLQEITTQEATTKEE